MGTPSFMTPPELHLGENRDLPLVLHPSLNPKEKLPIPTSESHQSRRAKPLERGRKGARTFLSLRNQAAVEDDYATSSSLVPLVAPQGGGWRAGGYLETCGGRREDGPRPSWAAAAGGERGKPRTERAEAFPPESPERGSRSPSTDVGAEGYNLTSGFLGL